MRDKPAKCPKGANPYIYCPLMFVHEDDFIAAKIELLAQEAIRVQGDSVRLGQIIDRYSCEITAYMNGRIHGILFDKGKG